MKTCCFWSCLWHFSEITVITLLFCCFVSSDDYWSDCENYREQDIRHRDSRSFVNTNFIILCYKVLITHVFVVVCEDTQIKLEGFLTDVWSCNRFSYLDETTDVFTVYKCCFGHKKSTENLQCNLVCLCLGYKYGKYLFFVCDAVSALIRACLSLKLLVLHLCSCHSDTIAAAQCFPCFIGVSVCHHTIFVL